MKKEYSEYKAEICEFVLPSMLNNHGTYFGGKALEMMDKVAAIVAMRYARKPVVTAHTETNFHAPINNADIVTATAKLVKVGRTSMTIEVNLVGEDPYNGETVQACTSKFIMVSVGPDSKPVPIKE